MIVFFKNAAGEVPLASGARRASGRGLSVADARSLSGAARHRGGRGDLPGSHGVGVPRCVTWRARAWKAIFIFNEERKIKRNISI